MKRFALTAVLVAASLSPAYGGAADATAAPALPDAKPVPRMQAVPQPYDQVSFRRGGTEIARVHFGPGLRRPFVFPVVGPAGRSLTRMGHPHDPVTHSHHNSVWISHHDVDGVNFWADHGRGLGTIVHQRVERLEDADDEAAVQTLNHWVGPQGKVRLVERRRVAVRPMEGREWLMLVDLEFAAPAADRPATFNVNPFGLLGVRMAKTIGIHDGGGTIRNSEGQRDEKGPNGCFRKPARWCDYSGPIAPGTVEGVTLMDHPSNVNHPTPFHVRGDGWMGACLTLEKPVEVTAERPLRLRYGLWIHAGLPTADAIDQIWKPFAATKVAPLKAKR
jgi:hypothetical protein